MIPYKFRFHGYNALRYVYKNGISARSQCMTIKVSLNHLRTSPRFAVVVSKKVLKSAVGRNRIRRRVYEIVRSETTDIQKGIDIAIIITHKDVLSMDYSKLHEDIHGLLDSAGVYKTEA